MSSEYTSNFAYISGMRGIYCICDRCGEKKRRSQISKEWTGSMVCRATCLDPVPAQNSPPRVWPEGLPITDARPRPDDVFVEAGPIDTSGL